MVLTPDPRKMTPEQHDKLEAYQQVQSQLQVLQDIAMMTQEVINLMDDQTKSGNKVSGDMGALLVDIRESLNILKDKEAPEPPDYAKPVVEAVSKLEKALSASIKAVDVRPEISVNSPDVVVDVDMKGVEKAVKEIPKAFEKAINLIPKVEIPETDFQPLMSVWEGISEQLVSLENATRMKPLPGSMAISNLDEVTEAISSPALLTERYDYDDTTTIYVGTAAVGTAEGSSGWTISKFALSDTNNASGKIATDVTWTNRAAGTYA